MEGVMGQKLIDTNNRTKVAELVAKYWETHFVAVGLFPQDAVTRLIQILAASPTVRLHRLPEPVQAKLLSEALLGKADKLEMKFVQGGYKAYFLHKPPLFLRWLFNYYPWPWGSSQGSVTTVHTEVSLPEE